MGAPIRLPRFGGANHAYGHDNRSRAIRAHLAEFGVIAPVGRKGIEELLGVIADPSDKRVPDVVRACLTALGSQLLSLKKQILDFDRIILAWHRSDQTSKRLKLHSRCRSVAGHRAYRERRRS